MTCLVIDISLLLDIKASERMECCSYLPPPTQSHSQLTSKLESPGLLYDSLASGFLST